MFHAEFGQTPEQLFARFDYTPVAAASLAQVFRAHTHNGREVAIKVQYADLASRFAGDFGTIQLLQSAVKRVHKSYNFSWILDEVRTNLEQELDFLNEGRNGERCAADLRRHGGRSLRDVHVPTVYWELTTRRILTTEWIEGYKCTDAKRLAADGLRVADIDRKLFDTFAEQIFGTGFVHADPHPGNGRSCCECFVQINNGFGLSLNSFRASQQRRQGGHYLAGPRPVRIFTAEGAPIAVPVLGGARSEGCGENGKVRKGAWR